MRTKCGESARSRGGCRRTRASHLEAVRLSACGRRRNVSRGCDSGSQGRSRGWEASFPAPGSRRWAGAGAEAEAEAEAAGLCRARSRPERRAGPAGAVPGPVLKGRLRSGPAAPPSSSSSARAAMAALLGPGKCGGRASPGSSGQLRQFLFSPRAPAALPPSLLTAPSPAGILLPRVSRRGPGVGGAGSAPGLGSPGRAAGRGTGWDAWSE